MRLATIALSTFLLAGCGSLQQQYVEADKLTYQAVWPEYEVYVSEDDSLDSEQKLRRLRNGRAWAARIREAEMEAEASCE